jgi:cation:H+ antiporter
LNTIIPYIILIISFIILIKGSDIFIDSASHLACYLRVPSLIIGLTVVAFGTSLPEAVVNCFATFQGKNDIILGNIIGSNLINIGLVIGLSALLFGIKAEWPAIRIDIPFAIISSLALLLLGQDGLSRNDGFILAILFVIYLNYLWLSGKSHRNNAPVCETEQPPILNIIFGLTIGLICIVLGGKWIVSSSIKIALMLGLSEAFVGLTIIALGTSLPELVTCLTACYKKDDSMAIGNMIGSNIFNILFILSLCSTISPVVFSPKLLIDTVFLVFLTVIVLIFSYTQKKISRFEGFLLLILYCCYFIYIYGRN